MVPVAVPFAPDILDPPVALLKTTEKVSSVSAIPSSTMETLNDLVNSPCAKVHEPETLWKSAKVAVLADSTVVS